MVQTSRRSAGQNIEAPRSQLLVGRRRKPDNRRRYESTAGTAIKVETFILRQESTPADAAGAFAVIPATDPVKTITVAQDQIATDVVVTSGYVGQLGPVVRSVSAEALAPTGGIARLLKAPAALQHKDIVLRSYVRFTETTPGTLLPVGGLLIYHDDDIVMFTAEPSAAQL